MLQAVKWVTSAHAELKGDGEDAQIGMTHFKHTYCLRAPTRQGLLLQPVQPEPPSGICYVCSTAEVTVQLDTTRCTLEGLVKRVLKGKLGFNEPTIALVRLILLQVYHIRDFDDPTILSVFAIFNVLTYYYKNYITLYYITL